MSDESPSCEGLQARLARAEAEIRDLRQLAHAADAQQRTASALDSITEGFAILDHDGRFVFVNPAAERFIQKSRAELIGQSPWELFPEAGSRRFGLEYRRAVAENIPVHFEEYYPEPLNTWYEVRAYPSAEGLSVFLRDITERKQAEEALRASDERHRTILQTAMDGFWLVDMQGRLLEVNETYCRMSGYSAQELLAMRIPDLESAETADDCAAHIQTVMALGEDRFESRHRRKNGSVFDVEVSVQYRPTEGGRFVGFLKDVTERKRAEQQLDRARNEAVTDKTHLEAVTRALSESEAALRRANNELESANEVLRNNNETLEARVATRTATLSQRTDQLKALAREVTRAEERERRKISEVIHDQLQQLLSVARIKLGMALGQVGTRSHQESLSEVDDLIAESLDITRSLTAELSPAILRRSGLAAALRWLGRWYEAQFALKVTVEAEEDVDVEEEIRVALFRSVRELLFNVVKHAGVTSARVQLEREADDRVRILVSDDGAGFDPEAVRAREGTGVSFGLFSLRERLELLGGQFEVDSAPGRGASFTMFAPLPQRAGPEAPAPAAASTATLAIAVRRHTGARRRPARRKKGPV